MAHAEQDHRPPLTNGHDLKPTSTQSAESTTAPSNHINGHAVQDEAAPQPVTNGVNELTLHQSQDAEIPSSAPASTPNDSVPLASSQSAPDVQPEVSTDEPAPKSDPSAVDVTASMVQAPTSDLREETQPQDQERLAQLKEQKQQEDLAITSTEISVATGPASEAPLIPESTTHLEPLISNITEPTDIPITTQAPTEVETAQPPHHPPVPVPEGGSLEAPLDPAPSPVPQLEAPKSPQPVPATSTDQIMSDAPPSPAKVAREREDDDVGDEPSAKRAKTDEEAPVATEFKKPEVPAEPVEDKSLMTAKAQEASGPPMTKPQAKHLLKTIGNVKRITAAKMFLTPVDYVALNLPSYPSIIKNPMDLKTLEDNLRAERYNTVAAFVADFDQIVENSRLFNGPEHAVTASAVTLKQSFDKSMEKLPGPEVAGTGVVERKKKIPEPNPVKIPPARRESRSSLPGSARSPNSAASPQTFALNPDGVPIIRRDSTVDGRPKREIHRPAPKDLPYNQKPKKKKYQWELKFCDKVLAELSKGKYASVSYPFMTPVDPVALNIPTYHSIVKKPMDFGTMRSKLDRGEYENAKDFEADARLVFSNCYKFNPPGDLIHNAGKDFEKVFEAEWSKKREWLENNTPASGPQSPRSSPEPEESEDEDEEEEEEDDDDQSELQKLQQHIAQLSKQVEAIQRKKKTSPAPGKKAAKPKGAKKEGVKKAAAASAAKVEKKTAPKAKKEKAPYVTYEQKQDISLRINSLSESKMAQALKIIRDNMPNLKGVQDDEIELDIDELSNEVLYKLLTFVRKHAPRPDDEPAKPAPAAASSTAAPARKKNKPMSKHEQEARIAQVQNSLSAYNQGSPPACE